MQSKAKLESKDIAQIGGFLFLLILIGLNYSNFIPFPEWAFTLLATIATLGLLISHKIKPYVQKRKSDKKVKDILFLISSIRNLGRQPLLLSKPQKELNLKAGEIAWSIFKVHADQYIRYSSAFYRNLVANYTCSSGNINEEFLREIEDYFRNSLRIRRELRPIVFTENRYWYTESDEQQSKYKDQDELYLSPLPTIDRKISAANFGASFCVVIPMFFHSFRQKEHHDEKQLQLLGYIGFVDNDRITDHIVEKFQQVGERFEELYEKIKRERTDRSIDAFLNKSQAERVDIWPETKIPESFATELSRILLQEFYADSVEIWLKGMRPNPATTIFKTIDSILKGKDLAGVPSTIERLPFNYHTDCLIQLHNCNLGYIRIMRNTYDFSEIERNLLQEIEDRIDNFVRDIWEEYVIREVDHTVLNHAEADLNKFASALIKTITIEFDAMCGLFEVQNGVERHYIKTGSNVNECIDTLKSLQGELAKDNNPKLGKYLDFYYYMFMPLSLSRHERIGAIYIIGIGILTEVHLKALKRLEAHLDNIVKLYLAFENKQKP